VTIDYREGRLTYRGHAEESWKQLRAVEPNNNDAYKYQPHIEFPEWIKAVHGRDTRFPLGA
jgi:hypothetical protein